MRIKTHKQLDDIFINRHSPRSFLKDPVSEEDLKTIFEAAHWSPSCFNEQPWLYAYAQGTSIEKFKDILVPFNWQWASKAPVLMILFAQKNFKRTGQPNRWASFDAGASWMALALQAEKLGYVTRAMGGFDEKQACTLADLDPDTYEAMAVIALGKEGHMDHLPKDLQTQEVISSRKDLQDIMIEIF